MGLGEDLGNWPLISGEVLIVAGREREEGLRQGDTSAPQRGLLRSAQGGEGTCHSSYGRGRRSIGGLILGKAEGGRKKLLGLGGLFSGSLPQHGVRNTETRRNIQHPHRRRKEEKKGRRRNAYIVARVEKRVCGGKTIF